MSYASVEAKVQTLLQATSLFADADVTRGDYRVLDQVGGPYCVLTPGGFTSNAAATSYGQKTSFFWTVTLDLFVRYWGNGTEFTNLQSNRQTIIGELAKYPTLDELSGVIYAAITGGDRPRTVYDEADAAGWLLQRMTLEVHEKVDVSGGEYP
ncbi:MAG: hypothetical protein H8D74_01490 [Chloroflexi bacterium]|nr:hypothetical protein [Chloroflexota bacterium]